MEDQAVVERPLHRLVGLGILEGLQAAGQAHEVGHRHRHLLLEQLAGELALGGLEDGLERALALDVLGVLLQVGGGRGRGPRRRPAWRPRRRRRSARRPWPARRAAWARRAWPARPAAGWGGGRTAASGSFFLHAGREAGPRRDTHGGPAMVRCLRMAGTLDHRRAGVMPGQAAGSGMIDSVSLVDPRTCVPPPRPWPAASCTPPACASRTLSDITGAEVVLKFENHQFTASFKERGALNRLLALAPEERAARGVRPVGRQPRPGGGLPRQPAGHPGHHRHAPLHARREGQPDPGPGRPGGAARRDLRRGPGARRDAGRRARAGAGARPTTIRGSSPGRGRWRWRCWPRFPIWTCWWCRWAAAACWRAWRSPPGRVRPEIALYGVQTRRYPAVYQALHGEAAPEAGGPTIAEGIAVKRPGC